MASLIDWLGMRCSMPFSWAPVRIVGMLVLVWMTARCAYCIDQTIHPAAVEHNSFCAQYLAQGKLVEAEARCKLAIEYSPKYAEPYNQLGLIEHKRGRLEAGALMNLTTLPKTIGCTRGGASTPERTHSTHIELMWHIQCTL